VGTLLEKHSRVSHTHQVIITHYPWKLFNARYLLENRHAFQFGRQLLFNRAICYLRKVFCIIYFQKILFANIPKFRCLFVCKVKL